MCSVVVGFFFADPAFDADLAVNGFGFGKTVVDVLAQGVQRYAAFALPFTTSNVGATETTGALNTDTFSTESPWPFNGLLHGAAESDTAFELESDVLSNELSFDLGLLHLLNIEENFFAGELRELFFDLFDFLSLATDDDARTGGINLDANAVGSAFDEDARHGGLLQFLHEFLTDNLILKEELREIFFVRVPAGLPVAADGETETGRIGFLAHGEC